MSEKLFYNRDENISGVSVTAELSGMSQFTPVYGSQANFSANNKSYVTDDFYYNLIPPPPTANKLYYIFTVRRSLSQMPNLKSTY